MPNYVFYHLYYLSSSRCLPFCDKSFCNKLYTYEKIILVQKIVIFLYIVNKFQNIIFSLLIFGPVEESVLHSGNCCVQHWYFIYCMTLSTVSSGLPLFKFELWNAGGKSSHWDLNSDSHKRNFSHKAWLLHVLSIALFEKSFLPTGSVKMFRNLSLTCL